MQNKWTDQPVKHLTDDVNQRILQDMGGHIGKSLNVDELPPHNCALEPFRNAEWTSPDINFLQVMETYLIFGRDDVLKLNQTYLTANEQIIKSLVYTPTSLIQYPALEQFVFTDNLRWKWRIDGKVYVRGRDYSQPHPMDITHYKV